MIPLELTAKDALVLVDIQNDFLPGGSLAVPAGDEVLPVLNRAIALFAGRSLPIYLTRDWHPSDHCSFKAQGGIWPPHCIADTPGAELAAALHLPKSAVVISKATTRERDAYSGFDGTDLALQLQVQGIQRVFIGGLATDYCVLNTVKDALANGFKTMLLVDGIRAVDVHAGDGKTAIVQMIRLGAEPIGLADLEPRVLQPAAEQAAEVLPLVSVDTGLTLQGNALMQMLKKRKSTREFSDRELSLETLSRLLWAACGINRPDERLRTAPSAKNWQEIDVYVAMAQGLYLFQADDFALHLVQDKDIRPATGWQDCASAAAADLIYVADMARMDEAIREQQKFYAALDTGFISQNVCLFCAAEGLATVVRGWLDRSALAEQMGLSTQQHVILAQSVGYPRQPP